ncbi:MAG: rhomboid family intramembrane serine protease [Verrucomicrobia bacterium]|nr:rhomboid family intramembrane serine protease [Verrucomicrobiota bacterium]
MHPSTRVLNGADTRRRLWPAGMTPPVVTYAVTVLCGLIYLLELWNRRAVFSLLVDPLRDLPQTGWPSVLAITLVHDYRSPMHIVFNLLAFLALGRVVEQAIGSIRYLLLLVALAWVSSSYQLGLEHAIGIGLSGVIYGVFGFMLGASRRNRIFRWYVSQNLRMMLGWAVLCVVLTHFNILGVANTAHFSGLFFGAICGLAYSFPRYAPALWVLAFGLAVAGPVLVARAA